MEEKIKYAINVLKTTVSYGQGLFKKKNALIINDDIENTHIAIIEEFANIIHYNKTVFHRYATFNDWQMFLINKNVSLSLLNGQVFDFVIIFDEIEEDQMREVFDKLDGYLLWV